jgi:hypothetical protein
LLHNTLLCDLIYKYDTETQYWAGNEFLYFENKDIRAANNNISRVGASEIYNSYLYTNNARGNSYSFSQDINGNFVVQNFNVSDSSIEADYAWVYFSLSCPSLIMTTKSISTGCLTIIV